MYINKSILENKGIKKLRLGKNNSFHIKWNGISLEKSLKQFVLKVENKEIYEKLGTNDKYRSLYDIYITQDLIESPDKDYAFIGYHGDILSFEDAYKKALLINSELEQIGKSINIFCYNGYAFKLEWKYLNKDNRQFFKDRELEEQNKKYAYGISKHTKKGLEQSQNLTKKILGIKGQ